MIVGPFEKADRTSVRKGSAGKVSPENTATAMTALNGARIGAFMALLVALLLGCSGCGSGGLAADTASRAATCLSNTKAIGASIAAYAQDYDETFPLNLYTAGTASSPCSFTAYAGLVPYVKSPSIWICPAAPNLFLTAGWLTFSTNALNDVPPLCQTSPPISADISYVFNYTVIDDGSSNRPAKTVSNVPLPAITGLAYDGANTTMPSLAGTPTNPPADFGCGLFQSPVNPAHSGATTINCCFVDGHAQAVHVKQDKNRVGGAPTTCIGMGGQVVPVGIVTDTGPYQGNQEIWGTPISQNANGTWNWGPR